jgi:hypothetical protein
MAYSYDGVLWYGVPSALNSSNPNSSPIFSTGIAIGSNSQVGPVVVDSQLALNNGNIPNTQTLDIVSGSYYNQSYTNFTVKITSNEI